MQMTKILEIMHWISWQVSKANSVWRCSIYIYNPKYVLVYFHLNPHHYRIFNIEEILKILPC